MRRISSLRQPSGLTLSSNLPAQLEQLCSNRAFSTLRLPHVTPSENFSHPFQVTHRASSLRKNLLLTPSPVCAFSNLHYSNISHCDAASPGTALQVASNLNQKPDATIKTDAAIGGVSEAAEGSQGWLQSVLPSGVGGEFTSGGLTLMVAGALLAGAKRLADVLWEVAIRQLFLRVEFDSRDDSYRWIMQWLAEHPDFQNSTTLSASTSLARFGTRSAGREEEEQRSGGVFFFPAPGAHLLRFQGRWVWVSRNRSQRSAEMASGNTPPHESLSLVMLGRSREGIEALVEEARTKAKERECARTTVYLTDPNGYWNRTSSRAARRLKSVVLPEGQDHSIISDCKSFLSSEKWYADHGIPYRRGYLLYGVPGTGKTSLVTAIAGELGLDIYVMNLSSPTLTDETLCELMANSAPRCILLLEDVDAAFNLRESGNMQGKLTFSGVLNAIDGVAAQEGRLLFMTTNHRERLDPALIRPGRVDLQLEFKLANTHQISTFVKYFYSSESAEDVDRLIQLIPEEHVSIAQLQGYLMKHLHSPVSAAHNIHQLL
mmetsp:Transcript_526/g.602  ORF Transcript_526/g.602 Transcript_526/m.602 type:complete len:546 (+) Transcript_526:277-1914(+)|eukprot:CAMPEP_0197850952 /NCGR_PEP_ID=MMETSP1438-20131217/16864_1 /TAXON_ID=1461541 /ORGANISM="Pterosperma sp., Strain CCMP1384" /LENGTH=545 /DNA_ID=CAMNT_0043464381 /DNA_START=273 /DNA_END=1910 /DNA_ORIENTATION=+